jgi:hypothetical protein
MKELNGREFTEQDKDIEIERLKTTCSTLNNIAAVTEDLKNEVSILKRQLDESDGARARLERDNEALKHEIFGLRTDLKAALQ